MDLLTVCPASASSSSWRVKRSCVAPHHHRRVASQLAHAAQDLRSVSRAATGVRGHGTRSVAAHDERARTAAADRHGTTRGDGLATDGTRGPLRTCRAPIADPAARSLTAAGALRPGQTLLSLVPLVPLGTDHATAHDDVAVVCDPEHRADVLANISGLQVIAPIEVLEPAACGLGAAGRAVD